MVAALLQRETLRLLTVGIDINSSTSHLLFARVLFQRLGSRATARFVPEVLEETFIEASRPRSAVS
jgi:ethanolamine utilization protein EutA